MTGHNCKPAPRSPAKGCQVALAPRCWVCLQRGACLIHMYMYACVMVYLIRHPAPGLYSSCVSRHSRRILPDTQPAAGQISSRYSQSSCPPWPGNRDAQAATTQGETPSRGQTPHGQPSSDPAPHNPPSQRRTHTQPRGPSSARAVRGEQPIS